MRAFFHRAAEAANRFAVGLASIINCLDCIVFNFRDWCTDHDFQKAFSLVTVMIYATGVATGLFISICLMLS